MKNILKNRLCLMLTLALVLALLPSVGGYAAESTGINPVEVTNVKAAKDYTFDSKTGVLKLGSSFKKLNQNSLDPIGYDTISKTKTLVIPAGTKTINAVDSWYGFSNLEKIEVNKNNKNFTAVDGVLYTKDMKKIIYYPANKSGKSYTIGSKVTTIGYAAFSRQGSLTKITVPKTVKSIEGQAFSISAYDVSSWPYWKTLSIKVYFEGKAPSKIEKNAFLGCAKVTAYYPKKYASSWKGKTKKYSEAWSNDLKWKSYE